MISPAAAELIRRAKEQVRAGTECALGGNTELAHVWFRSVNASLDALHALLDEPLQKPIRRMALVVMPREEEAELPEWATKKHGEPEGAA